CERRLEPVLGRPAALLLVPDPARARHVLRADHVHLDRPFLGARANSVDQRLADDGLVRDNQEACGLRRHQSWAAAAGTPLGAGSFSLKTACRAPGTPYS